MAGKLTAQERKWRTQEDLSTLKRAAEINADRARTAAVRKAANDEVAKLKNLAGTAARKGK
jgi:hypothetical protein